MCGGIVTLRLCVIIVLQRPTLYDVVEWIDLDTICLLFGMVGYGCKQIHWIDPLPPSLPPSLPLDDAGGYICTDWIL